MPSLNPERDDFTSYGLSCVRWNPSPMRRPDHHNEIQLNMLVRGRVTYMIGSRKVRVPAGKFTAFWAAMPHQIVDYDRETEYFVATLPLAWFLQCQLSDNLVQPLMRGEVVSEALSGRAAFDAALFQQWEGDLKQGGREMREIVIQEMTTRLRRLAVTVDALKSTRSERIATRIQAGRLNKVEQIVCYIAQQYAQPITVTDIGREVGLHPNSAMRLFKRVFGTTLVNHLTHHRIFHAKRLLATTDQKIVDVAFGSGFSSISRFNEAFRNTCGCSPREYRLHHDAAEGAARSFTL